MDEPGGDLDKDIDLAVEDHQREVAMLALLHDLLAGRESDRAATRGDGMQRARIEAREDRVQRQHPGDLLDRGCWRRYRRRVLLPRCHAAISTTAARARQTGPVPGRTSGSASLIPTAAAGGAKLLAALKEPPLDPRPFPGLCVIEALLRLANSLTQIAAALPITLHRQDVRGRRRAFRKDRPGLSGKRKAQCRRDQNSGENPGFQHDPPLVRISSFWRQRLGQSTASMGLRESPRSGRAHSQKAITIVLLSSRIKLIRLGLWTMPATPCVGPIVRKPCGRSSSRTTFAVPAGDLPFSANFLPMHCLQSSPLISA